MFIIYIRTPLYIYILQTSFRWDLPQLYQVISSYIKLHHRFSICVLAFQSLGIPAMSYPFEQASGDLFSRLDRDGSGVISREEFEQAAMGQQLCLLGWDGDRKLGIPPVK